MSVGSTPPPVVTPPASVQPQPPPRQRWTAPLYVIGIVALVVIIVIGMAVQGGIGSDVVVERELAAFNAVRLEGSNEVNIRVGDEQSVTVRGGSAAVERLSTAVQDGTLVIGHRGWFGGLGAASVDIAVPDLTGVSLSGSGRILAEGVDARSILVTLPGSGTIDLRGQVEAVDVMLAGSGAVRLSDLVARDATVTVAGSGEVRVHATDSLRATITGSGTVRYAGDPETVEDEVTGSGVIEHE